MIIKERERETGEGRQGIYPEFINYIDREQLCKKSYLEIVRDKRQDKGKIERRGEKKDERIQCVGEIGE